jgi:hypothetical protein
MIACGGVSTTNTDAGEAGAGEAGADASACVLLPKIGTPCTPGQKSCDRVDPCCTQTVVCDAMTALWKDSGVACLQCEGFACGSQTCAGGMVCVSAGLGIPPPDGGPSVTYTCTAMPAACSRNWSCDCVTKNLPPNCVSLTDCTDMATHVKLGCKGA